MKIDINGLVYALSYALDCIEAEFVGISSDHAKRVAYLSAVVGRESGFDGEALSDLAACAALHDNALTEYIAEKRRSSGHDIIGEHCSMGERNIKEFPFGTDTDGFILYHHENADGSGPFAKRLGETPLGAQIIHLADNIDATCGLNVFTHERYALLKDYINDNRGHLFSDELAESFFKAMPEERYLSLSEHGIDEILSQELPHTVTEYPFSEVKTVTDIFGRIVDYKSVFTGNHSLRIAEKLYKVAMYRGYGEELAERLYVAGALHDVGKLAIVNDILEKPDRLSDAEFDVMKEHARFTGEILGRISGFDDIASWAAHHHEKLNGKGYPLGLSGDSLDANSRLLACVDIYQALREDRPYKPGLSHDKSIEIMHGMASGGFIDADTTKELDAIFA